MSDEAGFPWMKLYPSDFRGSAKVQAMSGEEVGYYFLLLLQIWEEGSIPDDPGQLWTICKTTPEKMKRAWPKIRPCMVEHPERDGHLTNPRVEEELGKARERRRRAKAAWEASADARGESDTHKHDAERHAQAGRSSGTQERDGERGGGASLARSDTSVATEASEATDGKEEQRGSEDSLPSVENPSGEAVGEPGREDDSGPDGQDHEQEDRKALAATLRRDALLGQSSQAAETKMASNLDIADQLHDDGYPYGKLEDAVMGARLAIKRREDEFDGWIDPGDTFGMGIFRHADEQGVKLVEVCATYWYKHGETNGVSDSPRNESGLSPTGEVRAG